MTDQRDQGHPPRKERDEPKRSPGAYIGNRPANPFETVAPPNRRDRTGSGPGNRPPGRFGGGGRPPSPSVAPRPDIAQPQPDLPVGRAVQAAEDDAGQDTAQTGGASQSRAAGQATAQPRRDANTSSGAPDGDAPGDAPAAGQSDEPPTT